MKNNGGLGGGVGRELGYKATSRNNNNNYDAVTHAVQEFISLTTNTICETVKRITDKTILTRESINRSECVY